jgi:hypothetical protein
VTFEVHLFSQRSADEVVRTTKIPEHRDRHIFSELSSRNEKNNLTGTVHSKHLGRQTKQLMTGVLVGATTTDATTTAYTFFSVTVARVVVTNTKLTVLVRFEQLDTNVFICLAKFVTGN